MLACIAGLSLACARHESLRPTRLPARIHAHTPDGQGVPGTRLWADGRELGTTDAAGTLATTLEARSGARVVITAACPSAYRTIHERRELALWPLQRPGSGAGGRGSDAGLQLSITCEPVELLAALVVRVRAPSAAALPIRVRNRVIGQTGPDATAHLVLRARPDSSVTVELDTSAAPDLEPSNPVQTFQLGKEPAVFVFDQTLTRTAPARRAARTRRPEAAAHRLPYRLN